MKRMIFKVLSMWCAAFFVFCALSFANEPNISKEALAQEVIAVLASQNPDKSYRYNSADDTVHTQSGEEDAEAFTFLGNIYNQVKYMTPDERADYLDQFLSLGEGTDDASRTEFLAALNFRTRIDADIHFRKFYLGNPENLPRAMVRPAGDLHLELVYDSPIAVATVNGEQLKGHNIPESAAFDRAADNLARTIKPRMWTKLSKHIWVSNIEDDFDAARLIATYDKLKLPFKGQPILYMPSHSVALITDSNDPDILETMMAEGDDMSVDMRPLSHVLWQRQGREWRQWMPDKAHPAFGIAHLANIQTLSAHYDEQNSLLDKIHEENNLDIFIAAYTAFQNDEGDILGYAVYPIGILTHLPKVDLVAVIDPDKGEGGENLGMIPWAAFESIFKDAGFKVIPGTYPPLYNLETAPRADQVAKLVEAAAPL